MGEGLTNCDIGGEGCKSWHLRGDGTFEWPQNVL